MSKAVKIISVEHLTHDVLRIRAEKPEGLQYTPGQAMDISINKKGWEDKLSAFTFTSLPEDNFIEFTIKTYPSRQRVTNELLSIQAGDEIFTYKPFGDISYKGEGIFLAGGAGITPFIAILRLLEKQHNIGNSKLIFANKTQSDIISKDYFDKVLGANFINILSDETVEGFEHGFINADLIKKYSADNLKYYYLCGPKPMMDAVEKHLATLGVDDEHIVKEGF
ncbi:MAG: flavodoxin reductase [Chitinophagaceae bacterium]|nr:flavodoxin reductase [Chitinophagaceae bacterium]MCW5905988.1 flavodoxin reductase [Chitinophagaceae bacterium]